MPASYDKHCPEMQELTSSGAKKSKKQRQS
jgi:hypothetical protein